MISQTAGAFPKDVNRVAMTDKGFFLMTSETLTANNTTASIQLFSVTGQCIVRALYGVVTTQLGNCTAAYFRLNDNSVQTDITLNTGTTISSARVGGMILRKSINTIALSNPNNNAGVVSDPIAATAISMFMPFIVGQKAGGGATNIEFVYTTTDTPTTGSIDFYIGWLPLTPTSQILSI